MLYSISVCLLVFACLLSTVVCITVTDQEIFVCPPGEGLTSLFTVTKVCGASTYEYSGLVPLSYLQSAAPSSVISTVIWTSTTFLSTTSTSYMTLTGMSYGFSSASFAACSETIPVGYFCDEATNDFVIPMYSAIVYIPELVGSGVVSTVTSSICEELSVLETHYRSGSVAGTTTVTTCALVNP